MTQEELDARVRGACYGYADRNGTAMLKFCLIAVSGFVDHPPAMALTNEQKEVLIELLEGERT